jgi:hypothetical protein
MSEMIIHDDRDTIITGLRQQLKDAREELAAERAKDSGVEEGVAQLRQALAPLKDGLDRIFGILPSSNGASEIAPRHAAVWESWKQKLGEGPAKVIDALLLHRAMNTQQLAIATGYHRTTVPAFVHKLTKAGLINKNSGIFSLKEL